jgi:two-component system, cell cycle sensor histidine kinase and response regulator CckA
MSVLVVDDEETVLRAARRVLERRGFRVSTASLPHAALARLAAAEELDLLLTDVSMPDLSGPELAARARVMRPSLRVLYMSGSAEDDLAIDEQAGVGFLEKPFAPDALVSAIDRLGTPTLEPFAEPDP